jgi:hypothetical protein
LQRNRLHIGIWTFSLIPRQRLAFEVVARLPNGLLLPDALLLVVVLSLPCLQLTFFNYAFMVDGEEIGGEVNHGGQHRIDDLQS